MKISVNIPAPKIEAVSKSRIKPKIREKRMPKLLVKMDLNISIPLKRTIVV